MAAQATCAAARARRRVRCPHAPRAPAPPLTPLSRHRVRPQVERLYREVRAYAIPGGSEEILLDLAVRQAIKDAKVSAKL